MSIKTILVTALLLATPVACGPKAKDVNGNCMLPKSMEQQQEVLYHIEIHAWDSDCKDVTLKAFIHGDGSYNGTPGISLNNAQVLPFDKDTYLPAKFDVTVPAEGTHEFTIEAIITMSKADVREFGNLTAFCELKRNGVPISALDGSGSGFSIVAIQESGTYNVKCGAHM